MGEVAVVGNVAGNERGDDPIARAQMPLSFAKTGETVKVARVRGKEEMHHHLETLGFVEGVEVRVVSEMKGDLIVEVKGAQIALNKKTATMIITQ